jgi:two-component system chemotaxis response regulator CheY
MVRVLIADDEPMLLELYKDILAGTTFKVVAIAYNGQECVDIVKALDEPPDVVLMDHRMPLKSGLEATREILAFDSGIGVIFVSADSSVREEALLAGAVAFLQKPFDIDALLGLLALQEDGTVPPTISIRVKETGLPGHH